MPQSPNALLARRWFDEVWNQRRDATVLELLDPKIEGQMEGLDVRSPEDFLKARAGLLDGFPDLTVTVDDVVADGDNVVVRWSASGTHRGAGLGIPPSDRRVSFRGMSWLVFSQGRIVRGWDSWNLGQLFQQLSAQGTDGELYGTTYTFAFNYGTIFKVDLSGNFTTLHRFGYSEGSLRYAGVIQALDGSLYGVSSGGGLNNVGTVFRLDVSGNLTTLHAFQDIETPNDGSDPISGLIQGMDGSFYGTADGGGAHNSGIAFKIDSAGVFSVLHSFYAFPGDGVNPFGGLVQSSDGTLYGTTVNGGVNRIGAIFRIGPAGESVLHSFVGYPVEGSAPLGALMQASDGYFYGTTSDGGEGFGTVFKFDSAGNLTTLHQFSGTDGAGPQSGLVQAADGDLYGTAGGGGAFGYGTVFKMDLSGKLTTLHSFAYGDGASPYGTLVQSLDGNFYGTTYAGGASGGGTIFRMDPAGNVSVVHDFSGSDGAAPFSGLFQGSDGSLYGTAQGGAGNAGGVVYRLAPCSPAPAPSITVTKCLPAETPGFVASVPAVPGDAYLWTVGGGTIDSGQGTNTIGLTSGAPGVLMSLNVVETNASNCSGSALENLQVDFSDESPSDLFYSVICTIARDRITAGCGEGQFCPEAPATRAQMAAFILKAKYGADYLPRGCTGTFLDVPCPGPFADWIEQVAAEGITSGCGDGLYCPEDAVTRAQAAVLLLKAEHGSDFVPPACASVFEDVACPSLFADWIERLYAEGITGGCSLQPLSYCPESPGSRGQIAAFLVKTFALH